MNPPLTRSVMAILFDKCNVNVFLDISTSVSASPRSYAGLMVLHNLLKAIRSRNRHYFYQSYSLDFYKKVYAVRLASAPQ